jgi:4-hydroxy-tetrahydrodipicolinate synthase
MAEIGRVITAMVTPFDAEGGVDYAQARRLAQALIASGSDGVAVAATTGEGPSLSHAEKLRLFEEVKSAIGNSGVAIANVGTYNTRESTELAKEAEKLGMDGLLLVVPYYNRPTQEGIYRHFEAIANVTSLPGILYNVPTRTGMNMTAETVIRLSQVSNIIGVKEASGNMEQIGHIIAGAGDGFRVWSGNDSDTLPIMSMGGYGVVSVVSHLAGVQMRQIVERYLAGDVQEAARVHQRILPLMSILMSAATNPIPVRYALNFVGFKAGAPRLPLVEPDEAAASKIEAVIQNQQIDLPVAV